MIAICFAATRAVHFGACLSLLSVCVFDRLIVTAAPFPKAARWPAIARRIVMIALPAALLSGIAWFALNAIEMSGLPPSEALGAETLKILWSRTLFGRMWKIRLFLWVAAILVATPVILGRRPIHRRPTWLLAIVSAGLVATLAWAGHGQTGRAPGWHLAADATHLLVAAFWPVGLLPFTWVLFNLRSLGEAEKEAGVFALTRRFSAMSLSAVMLLAFTGVANSCFLLRSISSLYSTTYGRVLILKVCLFGVMIALGAMNLICLKPRLAPEAFHGPSAEKLRRNVAVELVLAGIVLVVVGVLGRLARSDPLQNKLGR